MSKDEQDELLGRLLREKMAAQRAAACYKAKVQQFAESLDRAAHDAIRAVGGDWQRLGYGSDQNWRNSPRRTESNDGEYAPYGELQEAISRYAEESNRATQLASDISEILGN